MVYVQDVAEFARVNDSELRLLIAKIRSRFPQNSACPSIEDLIQETYTKFLFEKILLKFDPKHAKGAKISTYIYRVIWNMIKSIYHTNEGRIMGHLVNMEYVDTVRLNEDSDLGFSSLEESLPIAPEYETMLYRNEISNDMDGINFDLNFFEDHLEKISKFYRVGPQKRRKMLLKVFKHMREGMSAREIARKYDVSSMFISNIKAELKDLMRKFGITYGMLTKKKIQHHKRVSQKMEKCIFSLNRV
jgi:RNA polymerase sigma factor (sigma-70 family)